MNSSSPHNQKPTLALPPTFAQNRGNMGFLWEVKGEVIEILPSDLPSRGMLCDSLLLIGLDGTLTLVRMFGGKRVFFPVKPTAKHLIQRVLGEANARALCSHFGGERLEIPLWKTVLLPARNRLIRQLYANGENTSRLAVRFNLCLRQIRNICAK